MVGYRGYHVAIAGGKRVLRNEIKIGRAVDEDVVVIVPDRIDESFEDAALLQVKQGVADIV